MTKQDVIDALTDIRATARDDEHAHLKEDALYRNLLKAIADGTCNDPAGCAKLALTSAEIDFSRWYA